MFISAKRLIRATSIIDTMAVGIVGYGAYVPYYRIKVEEIASAWGANAEALKRGLKVSEKAVPGSDEDTVSIATEASKNAIARAGIDPIKIGAVFIGSESHPYAVKPSSGIVAEAVGATPDMTAADLEFACKAGTAAMQIGMGFVSSGMTDYALVGGADTAQGAPGDALEYTAAGGGAMFVIGRDKVAVEILKTSSYTTDTPDFWRREHAIYPSHGGRFTGEPAYFRHVVSSTKLLLEKTKTKIEDYDYVIFHQPNGKFPRAAAKKLGVSDAQLQDGLVVGEVGNTYSGCSILGLTRVLDAAKPGQKILMTSYGSGAGSDSFQMATTKELPKIQKKARQTQDYIDHKKYISYVTYAKFRKKFLMPK